MISRAFSVLVILAFGFQLPGFALSAYIPPSSAEAPEPSLAQEGSKTTWVVNSTDDADDGICDSAHCSLREAINHSSWGDTIVFDSGLSGTTILLTDSLVIQYSVSIDASALPARVQISGNDAVTVFVVVIGTVVEMNSLEIVHGDNESDSGGGILNQGDLTLTNMRFANNMGGITNQATLTIHDSVFENNGALKGAGIYCEGGQVDIYRSTFQGGGGETAGGIYSESGCEVEIFDSTLTGNEDVISNYGKMTLTNVNLSENSGYGINNHAGADMTLQNVTLYGNVGPAIINWAALTLQNVTIAYNQAGIDNEEGGTLVFTNTLIAHNSYYGDCYGYGTIITNNHNMISDGSCSPALYGDPLLGPLQDNGGETQTSALEPDSRAIDAGDNGACLATDQRGIPRPMDGDNDGTAGCDIGAFELKSNQMVNSNGDADDGACDSVNCTLREAIHYADSKTTVVFDPALSNATIVLGSPLEITRSLVIDASALARPVRLSGNNATRVIYLDGNSQVTLKGLEIKNGQVGKGGGGGGGIFVNSGELTLIDCMVDHNSASQGGGIYVNSQGVLRIYSSTIANNKAVVSGGGIYSLGAVKIYTSTVEYNQSSGQAGGIHNDQKGSSSFYPTLEMHDSTVRGNSAIMGGGVVISSDLMSEISNSTFSGNTGGGIRNESELYLNFVTITDSKGVGTDVLGIGLENLGSLNFWNVLIAGNPGGDCVNANYISDNSYNLIQDGSCDPYLSGDPLLDPLADNGGPTLTHALRPGSLAIDAGSTSWGCISTDQRGGVRPRDGDGDGVSLCDIGAFELSNDLDYGDAPVPYPTLKADNGARHYDSPGFFLGTSVDYETDGFPSTGADGDDLDNLDDEDGVTFTSEIRANGSATVQVVLSGDGYLHAWIDFNRDGDWADPGEKIIPGVYRTAGTHSFTFFVPTGASLGDTYARFRAAGTPHLSYDGIAMGGEVEDDIVTIQRALPVANPDSASLDENSSVLIDFLANDYDPVGTFQLESVGSPARGTVTMQGDQVLYTPNPDFSGTDSFPYTIINDGDLRATARVTVFVRNINSTPTDIQLLDLQPLVGACNASGVCTLPGGMYVGSLKAIDPDPGDTHTFNLINGSDFRLNGDKLYTQSPITFTGSTSSIQKIVRVSATDAGGKQVARDFTIYVLGDAAGGGPEKILLSHNAVAENLPAGTDIGILTTQEGTPRAPYTYFLVPGEGSNDNAKFQVSADHLETAAPLDFETKELYRVRVRTQNNLGQMKDEIFTIQALDDTTEPPQPPPYCSGGEIELINAGIVQLRLLNAIPSNVSLQGCILSGDLSISFRGWSGSGYSFHGTVNQHNQLTAESGQIGPIEMSLAGVPLKVQAASLEFYDGRYGLRLGGASFCLPAEWGGLCAPSALQGISMLLDDGGLKTGAGIEIGFPEIKLGKALSISQLKGSLNAVPGGYEITLGGEFGLPKFKAGGSEGCAISASVTIYAGEKGEIIMQVNTDKATVKLREISVGMSCDTGIPIDATGLALTGVEGTVSLYPDSQYVSLTLTIQTVKKIPGLNISPIKGTGTAKVQWKPDWAVELSSALYLLEFFQISQTTVLIRENQFSFTADIDTWIISTTLTLNAWANASGFHLTGQGIADIGFKQGNLVHECVDIWYPTKCCWKWGFIPYPCRWRSTEVCLDIPPFDLLFTVGVDFGEFTNGEWGFKAYVSMFGINVGIYIDGSPALHVGGVSKYQLVTPPKIQKALAQWRTLRSMGIESPDLSSVNPDILVSNDHRVAVRVPIQIKQPENQSKGQQITPYELENQKDTLFTLTTSEPLLMTLQAPDGTVITPTNYDQPPVNSTYTVEYTQDFYYQADSSEEAETADQPQLRFILAATYPDWSEVNVSLDGVLLFANLGLDASGPANYVPIYAGTHTLEIVPSAGGTPVSIHFDAVSRMRYTVLASGDSEVPSLDLITDDHTAPSGDGLARLRFINSAPYADSVDVSIAGTLVLDDAAYMAESAYFELPEGENLVEIKDSLTGASLAPAMMVDLSGGGVYTLFSAVYPVGEYQIAWSQYQDTGYLKRYYTQYKVQQAPLGEWLVILDGDLESTVPILDVIGFANSPRWGDVIGQASDPFNPEVTWELTANYLPATVSIYADPVPVVKSDPPIFDGYQVADVMLTLPQEVNGEPYTQTVDLSALETGTYTLWVSVQDGVNPPVSTYVLDSGGGLAEFNIDQSATFPATWTPNVTVQLGETQANLFLQWSGLDHPDVDSYSLYFNTLPLTPVLYTEGLSAYRETDKDGKAVGDLLVNTSVSNLMPGQTYYYSFEAVDEDSGKRLSSPEYTLTIPGGDFQLTTTENRCFVNPGSQAGFLLSMQEIQPLFYPNVGLNIDTSQLPAGMRVWFDTPLGGDVVLNSSSGPIGVRVDAADTVPIGIYPLTITGDNGVIQRSVNVDIFVWFVYRFPIIRR